MFLGPVVAILGSIFIIPSLRRGFEQRTNKFWPNELIGPGESTALKRRGELSDEDFYNELKKRGLDEKHADLLFKLTEQRLDPSSALLAQRRQFIDKEKATRELTDQGWSEGQVDTLFKLTEFLPGPQDIVTWLGREVFEPRTIENIGLTDEWDILKPHGTPYFDRAGVKEGDAKNFWIAHWQHPSLMQIREAIWRGYLDPKLFDTWCKLVEFPPFWREMLFKILFRPFTRVDVRRMHKFGVLDRDGVKRAYLDIGYDNEKAEKMTEFTEKYNEEPEELEKTETDRQKDELKGLTRSAIIKKYVEGLLKKEDTKTYLSDIGLSDEVSDFYITWADYEREDDRVSSYLRAYRRNYLNGVYTYDDLIDRLGKLNLPAKQVDYLTDLWDTEKIATPSQPSKAEYIKMAKKNIISLDTLKEKLADLGYSLKHIDLYFKLYGLEPEA